MLTPGLGIKSPGSTPITGGRVIFGGSSLSSFESIGGGGTIGSAGSSIIGSTESIGSGAVKLSLYLLSNFCAAAPSVITPVSPMLSA